MNGYYKVETEIEKSNIINTEEQQIREALIKLGWTPPANEY